MEKWRTRMLIAMVLVLALCCAGVYHTWQKQVQEMQQQIDERCQELVSGAYHSFQNYQTSDAEASYLWGTSQLYAFIDMYRLSSEYDPQCDVKVSDVCMWLLDSRERLDENDINILVESLEILNGDYSRYDGYTHLNKFYN